MTDSLRQIVLQAKISVKKIKTALIKSLGEQKKIVLASKRMQYRHRAYHKWGSTVESSSVTGCHPTYLWRKGHKKQVLRGGGLDTVEEAVLPVPESRALNVGHRTFNCAGNKWASSAKLGWHYHCMQLYSPSLWSLRDLTWRLKSSSRRDCFVVQISGEGQAYMYILGKCICCLSWHLLKLSSFPIRSGWSWFIKCLLVHKSFPVWKSRLILLIPGYQARDSNQAWNIVSPIASVEDLKRSHAATPRYQILNQHSQLLCFQRHFHFFKKPK